MHSSPLALGYYLNSFLFSSLLKLAANRIAVSNFLRIILCVGSKITKAPYTSEFKLVKFFPMLLVPKSLKLLPKS